MHHPLTTLAQHQILEDEAQARRGFVRIVLTANGPVIEDVAVTELSPDGIREKQNRTYAPEAQASPITHDGSK